MAGLVDGSALALFRTPAPSMMVFAPLQTSVMAGFPPPGPCARSARVSPARFRIGDR